MNLDDRPSGLAGSESNESPTSEAWLAERKRFLEDIRLQGSVARIPRCPPDITIEKVRQGWPVFWKCMREALRVARQKDCPPGVDPEDGLMAMRELEKMVRESFRWLKRVERSPAKATYDKKRAAGRAGRDKERTGRSGNPTLRRGAETIAESEKRLEAQRQSRASYDKQRCARPSGHLMNARPVGGHFVIVDSEGVILNENRIPATRTRGKETRILQRTCLWMAGGAEGYEIKSWRTKAAFPPRESLNGSHRCRRNLRLETPMVANRPSVLTALRMTRLRSSPISQTRKCGSFTRGKNGGCARRDCPTKRDSRASCFVVSTPCPGNRARTSSYTGCETRPDGASG
jgi:hypothetical protein